MVQNECRKHFRFAGHILLGFLSADEHLVHLKQVAQHLKEHGLIANLAKCHCKRPVIDFIPGSVIVQSAGN